jgi:hypothetical protein
MFYYYNEEIKRQSPTNNQEPEHANYLDQGTGAGTGAGTGRGTKLAFN